MKTSTKIIIGIVAVVAAIAFFGYKKYQKMQSIFEKITIELAGIKDLKITSQFIGFNASVKFTNSSNEDFSFKGYIVSLKQLNFYYKGKYIGKAIPNLEEIYIPKYNELVVENIPVIIPFGTVFSNLSEITTFNSNYLTSEAVVSVAGYEFLIN